MTSLQPLHDRIVVRRLEAEERTAGGIIIPDSGKEKPSQGEVLACGPGATKDSGEIRPMQVKQGDTVLFKKWGAEEVKVDGEDLLILKEEDVLAIVSNACSTKKAA